MNFPAVARVIYHSKPTFRMNFAAEGDTALAGSDVPKAIQCYTQALIEIPRAPSYYTKRSTAYCRLRPADGGPNLSLALRDAEIALQLARERGKRELILLAQMRRGIVLYQLGRYGDAAFVFGKVKEKIGGDEASESRSASIEKAMAEAGSKRTQRNGYEQELPIWLLKVNGKLKNIPEGDERKTVAVTEYPSVVEVPSEKDLRMQLEALRSKKPELAQESGSPEHEQRAEASAAEAAREKQMTGSPAGPPASSSKAAASAQEVVRHEWYQSNSAVVVTLYAKGVPKDAIDVDIKEDSVGVNCKTKKRLLNTTDYVQQVSLQFPLKGNAEYAFSLDPLFAKIDPAMSKVSVMSTKVELSLHKKVPGHKWGALEASAVDQNLAISQAVRDQPAPMSAASVPAYPTSSRHGVKDWDKLASTLTKSKDKSKPKSKAAAVENDGSSEAEAAADSDGAESVDSDFGGDSVDAFFKKLYAGADPDTRRAMMKSYIESQGTALSTNWSEVGKGKVEARPSSDPSD